MRKQLGRAPEQLDPGALLLLLEQAHNRIQPLIGFAQSQPVRRHVPIMKGVIRCPQLFSELEKRRDPGLGEVQPAFTGIPGTHRSGATEHVAPKSTHGVPIND